MDGYAVVFRDVADATPERPAHLPVVGEIAAGQTTIFSMSPGTAVRIMTGAPIPAGCTAVVPIEATDGGIDKVLIREAPSEGQHIRRAGEDVRAGDLILAAGERIDARRVGLLTSVGLGRVATRPRPRVVIMSTGTELVEPGGELGRDQIYDSNSYLLAAAARNAGAIAYRVEATPDDPAAFTETLSDQLVLADVVVTRGGVSKGSHDVVKEALQALGTVDFLEVAMQPGKPQGFGLVGEDSTPIFTLPGNPVSAYVSFELFVAPALRKMTGRTPYTRPLVRAQISSSVTSIPGRRQFLRGFFEPRVGGSVVTPVGGAGSHLVLGLARSNALIVLGEDVRSVQAGSDVPVILLDREY
jgi:molybdopterin molybdotransferase